MNGLLFAPAKFEFDSGVKHLRLVLNVVVVVIDVDDSDRSFLIQIRTKHLPIVSAIIE
jgi:hypothetical protein